MQVSVTVKEFQGHSGLGKIKWKIVFSVEELLVLSSGVQTFYGYCMFGHDHERCALSNCYVYFNGDNLDISCFSKSLMLAFSQMLFK